MQVSVEKNSRLPTTGTACVYLLPENPNRTDQVMEFKVYQGMNDDAATARRYVAYFTYTAYTAGSHVEPSWEEGAMNAVEVTVNVDAHGGITALVHDMRWGNTSTRT